MIIFTFNSIVAADVANAWDLTCSPFSCRNDADCLDSTNNCCFTIQTCRCFSRFAFNWTTVKQIRCWQFHSLNFAACNWSQTNKTANFPIENAIFEIDAYTNYLAQLAQFYLKTRESTQNSIQLIGSVIFWCVCRTKTDEILPRCNLNAKRQRCWAIRRFGCSWIYVGMRCECCAQPTNRWL